MIDNNIFVPEDWGKQQDKPFIQTDFNIGDPHRSRYDANAVAYNARQNIEHELSDMVRNREIRGGRKRIERIKQKYRDSMNDRLDAIAAGGVNYENGQFDYGDNFSGKDNDYGRRMNSYLGDVLQKTGSAENRIVPTLMSYLGDMYFQNKDLTEDEFFKLLRAKTVDNWVPVWKDEKNKIQEVNDKGELVFKLDRDENNLVRKRRISEEEIWNDYIKPGTASYDKLMSNIPMEEYIERFIPGIQNALYNPQLHAEFANSHPLEGPYGPTSKDHEGLDVRGFHYMSNPDAALANKVQVQNYSGAPIVSISGPSVNLTGVGGNGDPNQKKEETTPVAGVSPYSLPMSINPELVSWDFSGQSNNTNLDFVAALKALGYKIPIDDTGNPVFTKAYRYAEDGNLGILNSKDFASKLLSLVKTNSNSVTFNSFKNNLTNYIGSAGNNELFIFNMAHGDPTGAHAKRLVSVNPTTNTVQVLDAATLQKIATDAKINELLHSTNSSAWTLGSNSWDADKQYTEGQNAYAYGKTYK